MTEQTTPIAGYRFRPIDRQLEQALVQDAQAGDSEAFARLYERLLDPVYRYIYFRVTDDAIAEDLTSKVFLSAWQNIGRYKAGGSPFMAWLYTIAHNAVIDHYRTHKQTAPLDEIVSLASDEPAPDEQLQDRLRAEALRRALQLLTSGQREVITLKLVDGLSTEEIAVRLGKRPGAVRALQMRALQALSRILADKEVAA